jgi:hypothetical protein
MRTEIVLHSLRGCMEITVSFSVERMAANGMV